MRLSRHRSRYYGRRVRQLLHLQARASRRPTPVSCSMNHPPFNNSFNVLARGEPVQVERKSATDELTPNAEGTNPSAFGVFLEEGGQLRRRGPSSGSWAGERASPLPWPVPPH